MKAKELLRRYAAGERDFRYANLRGQNFKGRDLSNSDLSYADLRGANFNFAIQSEKIIEGVAHPPLRVRCREKHRAGRSNMLVDIKCRPMHSRLPPCFMSCTVKF